MDIYDMKKWQDIYTEVNEGWIPNWSDKTELKYYLYKNFIGNLYYIDIETVKYIPGVYYFKSQKAAAKAYEILKKIGLIKEELV
jgi:hypothetical protein